MQATVAEKRTENSCELTISRLLGSVSDTRDEGCVGETDTV